MCRRCRSVSGNLLRPAARAVAPAREPVPAGAPPWVTMQSTGAGAAKEEAPGCLHLEALTPPLIMAVAFLIGLALFLRHQMRPGDRSADDGEEADIAGRASNDDPGDVNHGPSSDQHKV